MSKPKRPTYGELRMEQVFGPWFRMTGKASGAEVRRVVAEHHAEEEERRDKEAPTRRALRPSAQRMAPMSLREAARRLEVDAKSTRFLARFIDNGRLSFERSGSRWVFDFPEFIRVKDEEKAKRSTDGRRKRDR